MDKNDDKTSSKQRFLSPSYKKGVVKENKEKENFKIDLKGEEDDYSPEKNLGNKGKRLTLAGEGSEQGGFINLKPLSNNEEDEENNEFCTNALPGGHVRKIASYSQPGKGEDGFTKVNQDSYLIIQNEYGLKDFNIFAVLDGHGMNGHLVSRFVTKYFTAFFKKNKKMTALKNEDEIYERLKKNNGNILQKAFKHAERDIKKSEVDANFSGTTCVMVLQTGDKLFCSNIGDSRAILVKEDGIFELSIDQKPNDPEEMKRIEAAGGEVSQFEEDGEKSGPYRVWKKGEMYPGIAMSRSVGDLIATSLGVIPEPVFRETTIDKKSKFMVLASDGIWEFLSNQKVADLIMPFYNKNDAEGACKTIVKEATKWWNQEDIVVDDITAIVVFF